MRKKVRVARMTFILLVADQLQEQVGAEDSWILWCFEIWAPTLLYKGLLVRKS